MRFPGSASSLRTSRIAEIGADTGQVPDRWAPGVVGDLRPRYQGVRRHTQGQRIDRPRQPRSRSRARRGRASLPARPIPSLVNATGRLARRRGTRRAIVAVGRSILVIVWHLLSDPTVRFHDLGAGLLRHPHRSGTRQAQPHPPAGGPRLQGHPPTRRLTGRHRTTSAKPIGSRAPPGHCPVPAHRGFPDQDALCRAISAACRRDAPTRRTGITQQPRLT